MKLPRWIRQFFAKLIVLDANEIRGELADYKNGEWEVIHSWTGTQNQQAVAMVESMLNSGRDAIYVASIECEDRRGFFQVIDSNKGYWLRVWSIGTYEPQEAFADTCKYARALAKKMGWKEQTNG